MSYTMKEAMGALEQMAQTLQSISARNERLAQELEETEENEIQLIIQRDALLAACKVILYNFEFIYREVRGYENAQCPIPQNRMTEEAIRADFDAQTAVKTARAAVAAVEGENDQAVQR